jgi:hypothetical protein
MISDLLQKKKKERKKERKRKKQRTLKYYAEPTQKIIH